MKHKFVLIFCIILFAKSISIAGSDKLIVVNENLFSFFQGDDKKLTVEEKIKKYEGQFQIQVKDMRYKPSIPYNLDELIEKNRKQNEVTYVSLGSAVRLMILPVNYINKTGKKLETISTYND